ncbi:MAG: Two component transcriptional regulator, winged helix family protein [Thermoleophilia bacterium]|nr:Two component transcriptional regulator, winged helix family protein [Thermoleophilia bacterium]
MPERPSVLVVDDEPQILAFLTENLASDDFQVLAAPTIAHARAKLAHAPDLIVLDVNLPDGNGFDLCREIRDSDPLHVRFDPRVPVIMLTARSQEVDRVRGFSRGADDFVPKPLLDICPRSRSGTSGRNPRARSCANGSVRVKSKVTASVVDEPRGLTRRETVVAANSTARDDLSRSRT